MNQTELKNIRSKLSFKKNQLVQDQIDLVAIKIMDKKSLN